MAKARGDRATAELFDAEQLFPVRAPQTLPRALDFNRRLARAMSEAIRECGKPRAQVAGEMTELLGYADAAVTTDMLNAYTSEARETHTISAVRLKAFIRATGCTWLWDVLLEGEGVTLLQGREALHAQASLLRKQGEEVLARARALLEDAPVEVRRRRRPW